MQTTNPGSTAASPEDQELLDITTRILTAIHNGDADTYAALCANDLTCFEDVCPYRIDGIPFHVSLIKQMAEDPLQQPVRFDLLTPKVQRYGDSAVVTYTRLLTFNDAGKPSWRTFNESRVYIRQDDKWLMVHFHRTPT
jgi:ketosteroid isomerase-like protein